MTETLVIDRSIRGIGRICRRCGTTNPAIKRKYERMLRALKDDGRVDILRALRDGILTFADAYDAYRRGALGELATADTAKQLQKAWTAWIENADASDKHKVSWAQSGRYLKATSSQARVADLPQLLRKLRDTLGKKHPRSFNLLRAAVSAFIRDTLTRAHPLYTSCTAILTRKVTKKREPQHLTPDEMRNWFPNPDTDKVDAIAWGMATTGMGQGEYWGRWAIHPNHFHIHGTKRGPRIRDIPLIWRPVVPTMHRRTFENKLRDRTSQIQPYDFRRTFAHWMEEAGISRARRTVYLGHGVKSVTDLYERHEVRRFLIEDAKKLCEYANLTPVESPVVRLVKEDGT